MLMPAVGSTLKRMETDLYIKGVAHVRENPHLYRHRPLSKLELMVNDMFHHLLYGDTKPAAITIPDDVMATMPPLPA